MSTSPPRKRARASVEGEGSIPETADKQTLTPSYDEQNCHECRQWREQYQTAHGKEIEAAYTAGGIDMAADKIGKWSSAFEGEKRKIEQDAYEEGVKDGKSQVQDRLEARDGKIAALRDDISRLKERSALDREELRLYRQSDDALREARRNDQQLLLARQGELDILQREKDAQVSFNQDILLELDKQQAQLRVPRQNHQKSQGVMGSEQESLPTLDTMYLEAMIHGFEEDIESCQNHEQKLSYCRVFFSHFLESTSQEPSKVRARLCTAMVTGFKALGILMPDLVPSDFWNIMEQRKLEPRKSECVSVHLSPKDKGTVMTTQPYHPDQESLRQSPMADVQTNPAFAAALSEFQVPMGSPSL